MYRGSLLRPLAVLAAVFLVAAACNNGDGNDEAKETTTTTGPELTGEPIKLFAIYEKSAGIADTTIPEGSIAAAEAINRDGGIDGRPIEIIECDTQDDPNTAAECGRKAVDEGALAIVGSISTQAAEYTTLLEENKIPQIGVIPATGSDFVSPSAFPIMGGAPVSIAALTSLLAEEGATNIAMVRPDIAAGSAFKAMADNGLERFGIEIENDVPIPTGAPDMATYVAAALEGGTDAIFVGLGSQEAQNFVLALRQVDLEIPVALVAADLSKVNDVLGEQADGILQAPAFYPYTVGNEATKQLVEDLEAAGYDEFGGTRRPNGYAAVTIFAEIARGLDEITSAAVFDALNAADEFVIGLGPPVQFLEGGVAGFPRVFNPCTIATMLEGGVEEPVTGEFTDAFTGEECPVS